MILEDLGTFLQTNGLGTLATDIFLGELPLNVDNCVSISYAISPSPNKTLDVYEQDIDFWSRNKDPATAYQKLLDIQNLIHRAGNYTMGGFHIYFSNSLGSIDDNDRDVERRKLYKLGIRFIYRIDNMVS